MKKEELRRAFLEFIQKPRNKLDKIVWLWEKAIFGVTTSMLVVVLKENFILLVAIILVTIWFIYEFIARGR